MNNEIHQTKVWLQEQKYNRFHSVDDDLIKFFEKSGERECDCKNAFPIFYNKVLPNGETIPQIKCSQCNSKFYKKGDFHFKALVLGRTGGGKTTTVFSYADLLHKIDPFRKIKIWQCPKHLITILHNLRICKFYNTICERAMGEMKWQKFNPVYKHPEDPPEYEIIKTKSGKEIQKRKMPSYQENEEIHRVCKFSEYKTCADCEKCPHFVLGKNYIERIERLDEVGYNDIVILDEGIISVNAKEALSKSISISEY